MLRKSFLLAFALTALIVSSSQAATPMLALSDGAPSGGTSCVLTQSGKVYCWGENNRGQLGTKAVDLGDGVAAPQLVPLARPAVQIAAGSAHTCALLEDATVYCWGQNYYGQLGNTTNNSTLNSNPTPKLVAVANPVSQLSAGQSDTCLIYADGTTGCFGDNAFGQLGYSPTGSVNPTPKAIALGGAAAKKIVLGGNFACVLLTTLSTKCMGFNPSGQLANSAHLDTGGSTPVTANLGGPATDIAAGSGHACAILQDLSTWCWGTNSLGQLGSGTADDNDHYNPLKASIGSARSIALGVNHTCARLVAGGIDCWGNNLTGQLGVPDGVLAFDPHPVPLLSGFDADAVALETGGQHTCLITTAGAVKCAGDNATSELGRTKADLTYSYIAVTVPGINVFDATSAAASKLALVVAKPKLKFKKSGSKIAATSRAKVSGVGAALETGDCTGSATTRFERKVVTGSGKKRRTSYKKVTSKTSKLNVKKGQCGLAISLKVARKYGGKKLYLRIKLKDGAHTTGFDTRFSAKIKRP